MKDGIIDLDSQAGQKLGFTSDKFEGYLWRERDVVIISLITSKKKGNFRALVEKILAMGYGVEIPTPLGRMREIIEKNGYHCEVRDTEMGLCKVWVLRPTTAWTREGGDGMKKKKGSKKAAPKKK